MTTTKKVKLEPPDKKQCQAEITTIAPFMQMGGPPRVTARCKNKPTTLAKEVKPGPDGQRGSMTVCDSCLAVMKKRVDAGAVSYTVLPERKKA